MSDGIHFKASDTVDDPESDGSIDFDELVDQLDFTSMREQRIQELKREIEQTKDLRETDHGRYTEIFDEKEVIRTSASEKRCVIHFYHRNFQRCKIMDKHLQEIAPKYYDTRFIRVFVENVPWLVEKLAIKVLPCVICFIDGVSKDRIIGFEELGNADDFETPALEIRLSISGAIVQRTTLLRSAFGDGPSSTSKIRNSARDDDDDFDL